MIAVDRQRAVRFSTAADWLGALSADRQALREKINPPRRTRNSAGQAPSPPFKSLSRSAAADREGVAPIAALHCPPACRGGWISTED